MANLKKEDLDKRGNYEVLLGKFFRKSGYNHTMLTTDGQFDAEAIILVLDGDEKSAYEYEDTDENLYMEALNAIERLVKRKNARDTIKFTGRYLNTNKISTIKITDLVKTEEFGGQTGGKKINLGIQFENDFYDSLLCELQCSNNNKKYSKDAKKLIEMIGKKEKCGLAEVIAEGGKNQPRPLKGGPGGIYTAAGNQKTKNIGQTVTDITTLWGPDKNKNYLSLKYGSTLTFVNAGVGQIFTPNDYKNYFKNYNNQIGKKLMEIFSIDPILFSKTFNDYPHTKPIPNFKQDITRSCDKAAISDLLEYAIGYGYYMVHGGGSSVEIYEIDKEYMKSAATIIGKVEIFYGGQRGQGKRVDITMESSKYKFLWNLRNKQSGLYPSHIMCDYKKK